MYFDVGAKCEYIFRADMLNFQGIHTKEKIPFAQNDNLAPPSNTQSYIHPEYYLVLPAIFDEQVKNGVDEWVYVLKKSEMKKSFKARGIKEAGLKLDELKMTRTIRSLF